MTAGALGGERLLNDVMRERNLLRIEVARQKKDIAYLCLVLQSIIDDPGATLRIDRYARTALQRMHFTPVTEPLPHSHPNGEQA